MNIRWIAAYEPCSERALTAEAQTELDALGLARGECLALHGGVWGGADVVVYHPRERTDCLRIVDVDANAYPSLAAACACQAPDAEEGS